MSLHLEKTSQLEHRYSFLLKKEDLSRIVDEKAAKLAPEVRMDGFRKGKVPIDTIKRKYLPRLINDAFSSALQSEIAEEIKSKNLKVASVPSVDGDGLDLSEIADIKATVTIEVEPVIPEIDYSKIDTDYPELHISEEEMTEELKVVAESNASQEEVKDDSCLVKIGHLVNIDFEGFLDGVPFKNGASKGHMLEIGSNSFIPGFEDQIIGHAKGSEFDVNVTFPKEYHAQELAGKDAVFKVRINSIFERKVPEINEDFAKMLRMKDLEEVKSKIQTETSSSFLESFINIVRKKFFDTLLEKNHFDVPKSLVKKEVAERLAQQEKKDDSETDSPKKTEKEIEQDVRVAFGIWYFIKDVSEKNQISVEEKEVQSFIFLSALRGNFADPALMLQIYNSNPKLKDSIRQKIKEDKVIKLLLEKTNRKILKLSKKGFVEYLDKLRDANGDDWRMKRKNILSSIVNK